MYFIRSCVGKLHTCISFKVFIFQIKPSRVNFLIELKNSCLFTESIVFINIFLKSNNKSNRSGQVVLHSSFIYHQK